MGPWVWLGYFLGYFLGALPNALLIVVALMLGLFPKWVAELEDDKRKPLRYGIAAGVALLAIALMVSSALQMHSNDETLASLRTKQTEDYQKLKQQIADFAAHTPTVPKIALRFEGEQFAVAVVQSVLLAGVNITVVNDGDDANIWTHYAAGIALTPEPPLLDENIQKARMDANLLAADTHGRPKMLRHGESMITSAMVHVTSTDVNGVAAGIETVYFAISLNTKTTTGKRAVYMFCGYYQGLMVVEAC